MPQSPPRGVSDDLRKIFKENLRTSFRDKGLTVPFL